MITFVLAILTAALLPAAEPAQPYWPEFHGPNRDNISPDRGLLKKWPADGPKLLWKHTACGQGYSGVAVAKGMIFSAGDFDDDEMLFALSMDGKPLWKTRAGKAWTGSSPGSRATPTYRDGVLYHMTPTATVGAFDAATGKPLWSVDLLAKYDAQWATWALAENLVLDGDRLFCLPGGTKGAAVALDKRTGKTLWVNTTIKDGAAYCSPLVAEYKGVRQFITMTQRAAVGIDVKTGQLLWSHPHGRYGQNSTRPVYHDGHVFVACGHSAGGTLLKLNDDSRGVTQVWHKKELDNCHGGMILRDGLMYGCGCRLGGKGFFCVDFLKGDIKQVDRELGKVSLAFADGAIYAINDKGQVSLIPISPAGFKIASQFRLPRQAGEDLPLCHPVICGGRLYLRHNQVLYVFDVKDEG
jgi:outer membrane protein assembly factor BamB